MRKACFTQGYNSKEDCKRYILYCVTVSLSTSARYCCGSTITWQPCCCFESSGENVSEESDTHCCPSAATIEGPWSKVLNPPLLEWSRSRLNSKLRLSTHVTPPDTTPPTPLPNHHSITPLLSVGPDGKLVLHRPAS